MSSTEKPDFHNRTQGDAMVSNSLCYFSWQIWSCRLKILQICITIKKKTNLYKNKKKRKNSACRFQQLQYQYKSEQDFGWNQLNGSLPVYCAVFSNKLNMHLKVLNQISSVKDYVQRFITSDKHDSVLNSLIKVNPVTQHSYKVIFSR